MIVDDHAVDPVLRTTAHPASASFGLRGDGEIDRVAAGWGEDGVAGGGDRVRRDDRRPRPPQREVLAAKPARAA